MVFLGFGLFLVPSLFVLLVPFLLVWGAWVVFLGFGGSSCSCLVSSCSISFCFGGLGGFPGVWGVLLVLFLFLLLEEEEEEEEDEEKETRQDLWFGGYSCFFLVSFRRR